MALFTCILEFDGGTYISQSRTTSSDRAVAKYAAHLLQNDAVPLRIRKMLSKALAVEKPVTIVGVRNVWCCSTVVGKKLALLNIIATA